MEKCLFSFTMDALALMCKKFSFNTLVKLSPTAAIFVYIHMFLINKLERDLWRTSGPSAGAVFMHIYYH